MFANIPFYDIGGGQRSAQLTKTFNKMGYKVHYIYCFKSNESQIINMDNSSVEHIFIDDLSAKQFETMVNKDDLFIFEAPIEKYDIFLEIAKKHKCKIVYENIDNWETSLGSDIFSENILQKFLKNSDLLVGTAKPLVQQLKDYLKK